MASGGAPRPHGNRDLKGLTNDTLHERIEIYSTVESKLGGQLMALKWLGNSGSHEGEITEDDVLAGFEILEETLQEIVNERSRKIAKLTKQLHRRHGH